MSIFAIASRLIALASLFSQPALSCPLSPVPDAGLAGVLRGHGVRTASSPDAILFRSQMSLDYDGAPTAYHVGNADDSADPGLDHICNGADVLEMRGERLVNRYGSNGQIGSTSGVDPVSGVRRARLCKRDYIAIRDAGFPPCGPGHRCMRFYGVAYQPRSCGYHLQHDDGCGVPIRQRDDAGNLLPFYVTRNTLHRPGAPGDSRNQADFADATRIPFVVMPGGLRLPGGRPWQPGDLAIVSANGRIAFAVVGDTGPAAKIGEGSSALLRALRIGPSERPDAVTTLLFPGSARHVTGPWPLDPATFATAARRLAGQLPGGLAAVRTCPGFERLE